MNKASTATNRQMAKKNHCQSPQTVSPALTLCGRRRGIIRSLRYGYAFFLIMLFTGATAHAATLGVAQDGTQPYTSIQTAIDASTHGDIVLVYPGRYFENVQFNGKNITLGSLELITGNREYMYSTIIDGNQNGPVVSTTIAETNISLRGFTITNGTGVYNAAYDMTLGGGVVVSQMTGQRTFNITNCQITGNRATKGGGFWGGACYLTLSGVSIHDNYASTGGGIYFNGNITANYNSIYDPINRCNIFSNYAATGSDLFYYNINSVHVIVDTFTVVNPWNFYATAIPGNTSISNPYTFDIQHTVHEELNHDLYVAPWGDDANSGMSASEPMRSVFMAMYRIACDSLAPKSVYVADGVYSSSLNGQIFPIPVKSFTNLVGESRDGTILDAEGQSDTCDLPAHSQGLSIKCVTLRNGKLGIAANNLSNSEVSDVTIREAHDIMAVAGFINSRSSDNISLKNVLITNVTSPLFARGVYLPECTGTISLSDVTISHCTGNDNMMVFDALTLDESDFVIEGCSFHDNMNNSPDVFNTIMQIGPFGDYGTRLRIEMRNSAFYNNYQAMPAQMGMARALNDTLFIENCTFAGNTGGSGAVMVQGTSVLTNNIFHNPAMSTQVWIPNHTSSGINSHTTLRYNNILGGTSGVYNATSANPLIWGPGNTSFDPLFSMEENPPYTLSSISPLIDTGWQNASGLAEPGLDAGGNERLWDGDGDGLAMIDKGAYEYQPLFAPQNLSAELWQNSVLLNWEMPAADRGLSGYRVFRDNLAYADVAGAENTCFREHISQADTLVYQVAALYGNVESALSDSVVVIILTSENAEELAPALTKLSVVPNPFRSSVTVQVESDRQANASLGVYNLRGQLVKSLHQGTLNQGESSFIWDGRDAHGKEVSAGLYLLCLDSVVEKHTAKLVHIK